MLFELEIGADFAGKATGEMGDRREFEAGKDFFRGGDAADNLTPLENENFSSRFGKISGGDQPIMAGADDDRVVVAHDWLIPKCSITMSKIQNAVEGSGLKDGNGAAGRAEPRGK